MRDRFCKRVGRSHIESAGSHLNRMLYKMAMRATPTPKHEPKRDARKHPHTKAMRFSDEQVMCALRRIRDGETIVAVAESIDADIDTVSQWWRGLNRGHLLDQVLRDVSQRA